MADWIASPMSAMFEMRSLASQFVQGEVEQQSVSQFCAMLEQCYGFDLACSRLRNSLKELEQRTSPGMVNPTLLKDEGLGLSEPTNGIAYCYFGSCACLR